MADGFWNSMGTAIGSRLAAFLFPAIDMSEPGRERIEHYARLRAYRGGAQRRPLRVKDGQADDNLIVNFVGLIIERSISLLFGKGVTFDLPGEQETAEDLYLSEVWDKNKQQILLHKLGQFGSTYGTACLKILPNVFKSVNQPEAGVPRFIAIDPTWLTVETEPDDMDSVVRYTIRYVYGRDRDMVRRKEEITRILGVIGDGENVMQTDQVVAWDVRDFEMTEATGGKWREIDAYQWPYPFPPVLHWQNLPNMDSVYGLSDIEDVIPLQDRYNFIASNISKIIRYHAHPKTWGRGFGQTGEANWGPDEMITISGENGTIQNLEMQTDLGSSQMFLGQLRQALFDISRTVDISSMADKIGALTNFGLRVLYQDALAKLGTKRELYGAALTELNRRILELGGFDGADGGTVVWPEPLPEDQAAQTTALQADLNMEIVSKQTVAGKRGYDWTEEEQRIQNEKAAGDNIGAALLRAFNQGGGQ